MSKVSGSPKPSVVGVPDRDRHILQFLLDLVAVFERSCSLEGSLRGLLRWLVSVFLALYFKPVDNITNSGSRRAFHPAERQRILRGDGHSLSLLLRTSVANTRHNKTYLGYYAFSLHSINSQQLPCISQFVLVLTACARRWNNRLLRRGFLLKAQTLTICSQCSGS